MAPVHIPVHAFEQLQVHRRDGTDPDGSARLAQRWIKDRVSWDTVVHEVPDLVSLIHPSPIDELIDNIDISRALLMCLAVLPDSEGEILARRHGLLGDGPQTLDQIGQLRGVSRERIRQLESKAVKKARMLFAGIEPIKRQVIQQVRQDQPALAQNVSDALDLMCLTAVDVRDSLECGSNTSKEVVAAVLSAIDHIAIDVSDLPVTWVSSRAPGHLRACLTIYEPPISLRLVD